MLKLSRYVLYDILRNRIVIAYTLFLLLVSLLRRGAAIGARHQELMPVQVDRVVGHGQVADADAHLVAQAHVQRVDPGEQAACGSHHD